MNGRRNPTHRRLLVPQQPFHDVGLLGDLTP